jgi:hypothetical protein
MRRYGTMMIAAILLATLLTGCSRSSLHVGVSSGYVSKPAPCPSYAYGYKGGHSYSRTTVIYHHGGHFRHHHGRRHFHAPACY